MKMNTKSKLISSLLVLVLCVTAFAGSTYAWFNDSVTSTGNKIQAGTLDVDLLMHGYGNDQDAEGYGSIAGTTEAIMSDDIIWEPGKTEVAYLKIENKGNIDLKYIVNLTVLDVRNELFEVMKYDIIEDAQGPNGVTSWNGGAGVVEGSQQVTANAVELAAGGEHYFALAVHMDEQAGNDYMNGAVNFDITVKATQLASNEFGDGSAARTETAGAYIADDLTMATAATVAANEAFEFKNHDETIVVSGTSDNTGSVKVNVVKTDTPNITVAADQAVIPYEITVVGNVGNATVDIFIGKGLTGVKVFHEGTEMNTGADYNSDTGIVSITSADFSPFDIVFDVANSIPKANVIHNNETVELVNPLMATVTEAGGFSASTYEGTVSIPKTYTFKAIHDEDTVENSLYAGWYADFVISFSKDVEPGVVKLAGQYDLFSTDWVVIESNATIPAGEAIPLLGLVGNDLEYRAVCAQVKEFNCAAFVADGKTYDGKLTVELRLTNPENREEYYVVSKMEQTF